MKRKHRGLALLLIGILMLSPISADSSFPTQAAKKVTSARAEMAKRQKLSTKKLVNARELGGLTTTDGWTVRRGLLLRTAKLSTASKKDLKILKTEYQLGLDIDLRLPDEVADDPEPNLDGVTYLHAPINIRQFYDYDTKTFPKDVNILVLKDDESLKQLGIILKAIVDNQGSRAVLWHCKYGKDRTGLLAILLLALLGVDRQTITDEYMLTKELVPKGANKLDPDRIANTLDYMEDECGSVEAFVCERMGLTEEDILALRLFYCEWEPHLYDVFLSLCRRVGALR